MRALSKQNISHLLLWPFTDSSQQWMKGRRVPGTESQIIDSPVSCDGEKVFIKGQGLWTATEQEIGCTRENETNSITLAPGEYLTGTCFKARTIEEILISIDMSKMGDYDRPRSFLPKIRLSSQDTVRWKMAWRAIQTLYKSSGRSLGYYMLNHNVMELRCKDMPEIGDILDELSAILVFSAAAFIYGSLHALAWDAHFDSSFERQLWRSSACVIMGGVPAIYALAKGTDYAQAKDIDKKIKSYIPWKVHIIDDLLGVSWSCVVCAYILARGYLVVQCFINLFHLPAGVYDVPSWSAYFPHIS